MKNGYIETYKNYRIIKCGDDYIITDKHGATQGQATTEDGAKYTIDGYIEQEQKKRKTFENLHELKNTTQKAKQYINNYNYSNDIFLRDVYGSYSRAKEKAFEYCLKTLDTLGGYSQRITTFSKFVFTFAFVFDFDGAKYLCYITPSKDYKIKLDN